MAIEEDNSHIYWLCSGLFHSWRIISADQIWLVTIRDWSPVVIWWLAWADIELDLGGLGGNSLIFELILSIQESLPYLHFIELFSQAMTINVLWYHARDSDVIKGERSCEET